MATLKEPFALDRSLNTTELTPRNIADVLAEELSRITGRNASQVEYDNTESGLTADNVQDALDEINGKIPTVPSVDIQTAVDEFSTYNGGLLSSCKVALSPNQDLHGYSEPWVGGASKNKMPLTVENLKAWNTSGTWSGNTYSYGGMDFTILTDDDNNVIGIDENGTTSSYPDFTIFSGTLNGSYILCRNNARGRVYANGSIVNDGTADYSFTASGEAYKINLFTGAVALNHNIVKPMLVLSTETDYTFEPYSNICPISGHTQVDVDVSDGETTQEQVTVNLGGTYYSGTLDVVTGVFTPDTAKYVLTDISVLEVYTTDTSYGSLARIKTTEYPSIKEDMLLELASFCKAVANDDRLVDLHDNRCFINNNAILIRASVDENVTTVNELFAIFENCEFVMPLATPTPIQLSPTMVKALVGENHLSAPLEGQEITESKYKQMFTFDDVIAYIQSLS